MEIIKISTPDGKLSVDCYLEQENGHNVLLVHKSCIQIYDDVLKKQSGEEKSGQRFFESVANHLFGAPLHIYQ